MGIIRKLGGFQVQTPTIPCLMKASKLILCGCNMIRYVD